MYYLYYHLTWLFCVLINLMFDSSFTCIYLFLYLCVIIHFLLVLVFDVVNVFLCIKSFYKKQLCNLFCFLTKTEKSCPRLRKHVV